MRELENKSALVTGGARGIGAAIANRLAAAGAHVAINYAQNHDVAHAVMMLLGDDARWVTGQIIGGLAL